VAAGLTGSDPCIVVGDRGDAERVLDILERRGLDVASLQTGGRLAVLERSPSAEEMLGKIEGLVERMIAAGSSVVRLFGNVGWDRKARAPDAELFSYEARLTQFARRSPCVILCLHDVRATGGPVLRHGVLGTHPQTLVEGSLSGNPLFVPFEKIAGRLSAVAGELSRRQEEREACRRETEILRAIFDNIPVMISFFDAEGCLLFVNREWERILGWSLEEARQMDILSVTYPDPEDRRGAVEHIQKAERRWSDFRIRARDGRLADASWARFRLSDGTSIGFGLDVTERKRVEAAHRLAEKRLHRTLGELTALSARLRSAREEECARIAREVHDELGQLLTAAKLDTERLRKTLRSARPLSSRETAKRLGAIVGLLDNAVDAVHRIATQLRPGMLDDLGLEPAIEWWIGEFQARTEISCVLRSGLGGELIDRDRSTALFRIFQEALTNVARHAAAKVVEIELSKANGRIVLKITDDGVGIADPRINDSKSLGLIGMRERARALGGDVSVQRAGGGGTVVEAVFPL
jgi:PAS domain S-box-containing protein